MAVDDVWSVVVFRCEPERFREVIVDFHGFVSGLKAVERCHFLVRDRVDGEVMCSFRVCHAEQEKKVIASKLAFKLTELVGEGRFAVNPASDHPLHKYVAFPWRETVRDRGIEKFKTFCGFLSEMSRLVVGMAKAGYFDSGERVELAHLMCWMLGCTELGLLNTKEMQVGYFDRIDGRNIIYLKHQLSPASPDPSSAIENRR